MEPGDALVNEESEAKLLELQSNIQHLENKLRLTGTEKKADAEESHTIMKKNDLEIKRLKLEVHELEVRLERCQKFDRSVISKEFQKQFRDTMNLPAKSAKDVLRHLDTEALELQRKSKSLQHELELKERTLRHYEEQQKEMIFNCDTYFENEPTEFHSLQYIRELENEYQKISKYITESEIAENVLMQMKNQLEKNHLSNAYMLQAVQREYDLLQEETELKQAAGDATQQGETEQKKEVRFLEETSEQEAEMLDMKTKFEKIKEVTGVSDIQEAESRFLEQKVLEEKLSDLKKLFAKTLFDLKTEKKQLDSKKESSIRYPERDELSLAKTRLEEQEQRKERSVLELEKTGTLYTALEARVAKLMESIETNPNTTVLEMITKLEEIIRKVENFLPYRNFREI
ncbi:hypothetical protein HNY73_021422 [Argiope bruennichi]|uniref:Uncharacterized protein n=1 Tax=Argiope bruennichi TaxID=94029 RepID=A0A8T0DZ45_ARGBR|nr:hypothetical protein HNY73_021422 [Argiope bruennichi]